MKNKLLIISLLLIGVFMTFCYKNSISYNDIKDNIVQYQIPKMKYLFKKPVEVEKVYVNSDKDTDGKLDLEDVVEGARLDAKNKPIYKSVYYQGGYPPNTEGVCTDVVWRAFKNAGYNLKDMVDEDIKNNTKLYPRVKGKPDPNIDFRRVPNLHVFFIRHAESLTLELKPGDAENLKQWQGGDILTFDNPQHIAIVSDKRRKDGIPFIIHNSSPYTAEADVLDYWYPKITGHFRYPKK
ncbi:DUF1287 domain-containing protein [Clostridium peptidivorans]|uniref:DUF1287 domain-containing protein n=1 Tax=Clostridium peptidivorans TaxID=100174 RepID=UPI000BE377BF|nr:DUF1287 domain-containing protein [Clostridium peptidivorans]